MRDRLELAILRQLLDEARVHRGVVSRRLLPGPLGRDLSLGAAIEALHQEGRLVVRR